MSRRTELCAVGLGANLGAREESLAGAVRRLDEHPRVEVRAVSDWLANEAVGGPEGQPDYLNGAVLLATDLEPRELLDLLLAIEREHGRDRSTEPPDGPRTLDCDLLLHGERVVEEPGLRVPHPRMLERDFVLVPLARIAPRLRHPVAGVTMADAAHRLARDRIEGIRPAPRPDPAGPGRPPDSGGPGGSTPSTGERGRERSAGPAGTRDSRSAGTGADRSAGRARAAGPAGGRARGPR